MGVTLCLQSSFTIIHTPAEAALLTNRRVDFDVAASRLRRVLTQAPTPPEPLQADLCRLTRPRTLPSIAVESLSTLPPPPKSVDSCDHGGCRRSPLNQCRIHSTDPVAELLSTSPQSSDRVLSTSPHRSCDLDRRCRSPQPAITADHADRCRILSANPVAELLPTSPRSSPRVLSTPPILGWHPLTNRRRCFAGPPSTFSRPCPARRTVVDVVGRAAMRTRSVTQWRDMSFQGTQSSCDLLSML